MPIRAMTPSEVRRGLRHAADICIEHGRICWGAIDVCIADGTANAALEWATDADADFADTPLHAALFLNLVAQAGPL